MIRRAAVAMIAMLASGCVDSPLQDQFPTTLAAFRATLAAHDSATVALTEWCGRRGIIDPPHIQAVPIDDAQALPATPAIRAALGVGDDETVRVRHVQLTCGAVVLSDARNWYVPARLTGAMNIALDTTRVPFGTVVAPLDLHRQPLPPGTPEPASCPADTIQHTTAVLRNNAGAAYSLVSECYTRANIVPR